MFIKGFGAGERIAVWRADGAEALAPPRVRVLLPGGGPSVRDRAAGAQYVPSIQQAARKKIARGNTGPGRSGNVTRRRAGREPRTVVLPGDPTPMEAARRAYGIPAQDPTAADRLSAERLGVSGIEAEIGDALIDLGCWRERVRSTPVGPCLVNEIAARPDALAPPPLRDPDRALAMAVAAREMKVGDRVVNCFANAVLESITARAKALAWLQAEQHSDLAMLSCNYPGLYEMLPTEVSFALRISEAEAAGMISVARSFSRRLPATLEALRQGLINHGHAMAIARATSTTTPEVAGQVEADLLPQVVAPTSIITAEQLRRRAVRRVIKLDPDGAADRHRKVAVDRRITRWVEEDGMAGMKIYAPAQDIAVIWETATTLADAAKTPGDPRNLGNRRVDALTDLCADILYRQRRPGPPGANSDAVTPGDRDDPADGARSDSAAPSTSCGVPEPGRKEPGTGISAGAGTSAAAGSSAGAGTSAAASSSGGAGTTAAADTSAVMETSSAAGTSAGVGTSARARTSAGNPNLVDTEPNDAMPVANVSPDDVPAAEPAVPAPHATPGNGDVNRKTNSECATCGQTSVGTAPATATHPSSSPGLPKNHGQRPHIQVVIPYTVLLGGNEPCELVGHGAITADQARLIAADGVLRRLVTDPLSGTLLDYGRTRYEPPETLKQFVVTRDGTCRAPGCLQPALRGQIDHVEPFRPGQPTGGKTDHSNLENFCLHHHRAKDGGGFTTTLGRDGTSHWVTPLGRHYSRPPNEIWHPDDHKAIPDQENGPGVVDLDDGFPADIGPAQTPGDHIKDAQVVIESAEPTNEPPPF